VAIGVIQVFISPFAEWVHAFSVPSAIVIVDEILHTCIGTSKNVIE